MGVSRPIVIASLVLAACRRDEVVPRPDPATMVDAAPQEIDERKLLGHLLDLYASLEVKKVTDVPVAQDRWSGSKIRLVGLVDTSGPGSYGKPVARLKDSPSRSPGSVLWCRFPEGTTELPRAGRTVTIEGHYSVSTRFITQSPLSYWDTTLEVSDCHVVPSVKP